MVNRINSLDLIKLLAICGVLLIHLMGKTPYGGIFWYAQAVPIFMVLMGYNCKDTISSKQILKSYIPYLIIFLASVALALYKQIPLSFEYLPVGFLPYQGPGSYWILLYFLFIIVSPLLYTLYKKSNDLLFISILFACSYLFELFYDLWGGVKFIYSSCPLRYIVCFGLGMVIKKNSCLWFVRRMWIPCLLSMLYLYLRNYTDIYINGLMFENCGWKTGENCFAAFYSAMLVAGLMYVYQNLSYFKILYWGRITYYIFLFQILWFAAGIRILPTNMYVRTIVTFPICFIGGYILYKVSFIIMNRYCLNGKIK